MAKYDGLIIPRSYNDYINKSDPAGVAQALQLTGVMDNAPTAQSTKPAKSGGIFAANAVFMASNKTLSGVAISAGSVVRVLFTAALTGSNATTGLTLTYNGNTYAVKVGKNGALANFNAYEVESGVFKYLQAYTTLELMFDGTQFIIIGNPVVLSSADYTIYPDGSRVYNDKGVFLYFPCVTYPALTQYNGQNIPGLVIGLAKKTSPYVMLITAKEIGSNKFITYIYTFSNTNTNTFTLTVLSNKDVTIGVANGYGFIGYNGFDNTKEHLTTVQVLA